MISKIVFLFGLFLSMISLDAQTYHDFATIILQRGETYTISSGKQPRITAKNVTIKASDGTGPLPIVKYTGPSDYAAFTFDKASANNTIQNIYFDLGPSNYACNIAGKNQTLRGCQVKPGSGGLTQITDCDGVVIDNNKCEGMVKKYFIYCGGSITENFCKNIEITNNRCLGSEFFHTCRLHAFYDIEILNNFFLMPSTNARPSLTMHDGDTALVVGNYFGGGTTGSAGIGPLNGADGGLNEPDPVKKAQKLALRTKNITIRSNTFKDAIELCAGLEGLDFDKNCVTATHTGSVFWCAGTYGPRALPTGQIHNTVAVYVSGHFINAASAFIGVDLTDNNKFNGVAYP